MPHSILWYDMPSQTIPYQQLERLICVEPCTTLRFAVMGVGMGSAVRAKGAAVVRPLPKHIS